MDKNLYSFGYAFEPSKYSPQLGYSRLRAVISTRQTERFFDVKALHVPTFDGRFYHQTQVTRHELMPEETFQVCLGQLSLETYRGESLRAFSFGGLLRATVDKTDLLCELTSNAPIFKLANDPASVGRVIADELMEILALEEARLSQHEDELYARLGSYNPYDVFLACLVTLQKHADNIPQNLRRENYHKFVAELHTAINIIKNTDGWDGQSPSLEDLLSEGGH